MKKSILIIFLVISTLLISCGKTEEVKQESSIKTNNSGIIQTGSTESNSGISTQVETGSISEELSNHDSRIKVSNLSEGTVFSNSNFSLNFGSKYRTRDNDKTIYFKTREVKNPPYPEDITTYFDYIFEYSEALSSTKVLDSLKDIQLTKKPNISKIGKYTAIEYVDNGMCSYPTLIVLGEKYNYKFYPVCYGEDKESDTFKYLENIAKTITEFDSQSGKINQNTFSEAQIQNILAKIDENTKKQQEIEKRINFNFSSSQENYNDKMFFNINSKKYEISLPYNKINEFYCKKGDIDCTYKLKFNKLIDLSIDNKYLIIKYSGYESSGIYIINIIDNSFVSLDSENFIAWIGDGNFLTQFDDRGPGIIRILNINNFIFTDINIQNVEIYQKKYGTLIGKGLTNGKELIATSNIDSTYNSIAIKNTNGAFCDNSNCYVLLNLYINGDYEKGVKILKIYNLKTLKEIFSKEIN